MEIVISVAAKFAEYLVAPIIHPFTYCCTYKTNFEKLNNEVDKLKNARDSMQCKVDDSRIKGDGIQQHVEEWLFAANKEINEVETIIEDKENSNNRCLKGLCPNLRARYQLSKKAEREANTIVGLHEKGRFDSVSFRTIPEETWLKSTQDFMHFESRKSTFKEILDALSNRDFNMIGVYGMGGIGKTTLVKEVGRQAKENNLFEKVISSRVSPTPQIKNIQGEISEKIGLELAEQSHETVRAGRLLERLKKEKKILIILDDIWGGLDLEAIGIPLADDNSGCKVLLTARSQDVLSCKMDCQQNFFVDVLNEKEAWSLFRKMTGDCIENGELKSVATEIVKECAGLPIAIVPVARALINKRLFEWKDSLLELRRPSFRNISGTLEVAYKSIELSYNHLNREELKRTFLLIGYAFISCVKDVLYHGMGLGLFQNINTSEEAWDRAHTLVDKLKKSCLLVDGNTSERFSMHDVVRDAAISIASGDQHVFVVESEVAPQIIWPDKEKLKVCTAISLIYSNISELPQGFECPQLKYFRIGNDPSLRIPDNFFTGMTGLKVLDFTEMHLLPLPSSLGLLQNLQTLCLNYCNLGDIAIIGDLKKLEILSLRGSDVEKLVGEMGQLTQLRLLDLSKCFELKVIPPNVISSLSRLEELYIGESPIQWGTVEGLDSERRNASLHELNHLSKLTSLEILIQDEKTIPSDLLFFKILKRYRIFIGYLWSDDPILDGFSRKFKLKITNGANICLNEGHIMQLKGIEDLSLHGLLDMKNVLCEPGREGFPQLKHLEVRDNRSLFCVVDTVDCATALTAFPLLESLFLEDLGNLEKICRGSLTAESFCKLKNIRVQRCDKLKNVFPLLIGRGLQQLQSIEVTKCQNMEVIFAADRGDESSNNNTQVIELTQLRTLELGSLPQLTSFCTGDLHFEFPSLKQLIIRGCPHVKFKSTIHESTKKMFPNLEDLSIDEKYIGLFPEDLLCKLKLLDVWIDESTAILSLDDFLQRFHTTKILIIGGDEYIFRLFGKVENGMKAMIRGINRHRGLKQILKQESSNANNLENLDICDCHNLINLVPSSTSFQNLTTLMVYNCIGLIDVLTSSIAKSLVRLREMGIGRCKMIIEIVADDGDEGDNYAAKNEIVFSELKELLLWNLESLTGFCSGNNCAFKFPSLERLVVDNCPNMNIFSGGELSTPKLHQVQLKRWDDEECWTLDRDLNTTIQYLYLKKKRVQTYEDDSGQPSVQHLE
ncbi:putative disease resistance protein [Citrus sinensis]|uniref:Disease resistance protein n=1 Tax=Citrus sinensis TaxID=2711 RepID=A0ACB8KJW7_CITSI|nr:putative disease resistance protein [Citrus sinensis]